MGYREGLISRCLYIVREVIRKSKLFLKKIKKRWGQRREYIKAEYWRKKIGISKRKDIYIESDSKMNIESKAGNSRLAVYTCVFGNYDKIKEPMIKSKNCDYYIITDQEMPMTSIWKKVEPLNIPEGFETWHPAIKNRYYKMHPQNVFAEYDYSLYIDGNVRPITDMYPFLINIEKSGKIFGLFKHPIFNCLYDSAEILKKINLVDSNMMDLQVARYREEGFPEKYGFFECNLILRKHNEKQCRKVMETWWNEYRNGVKRDQQSFTYALWKNEKKASDVEVFGANIRENSRVKLNNHKRIHEKVN